MLCCFCYKHRRTAVKVEELLLRFPSRFSVPAKLNFQQFSQQIERTNREWLTRMLHGNSCAGESEHRIGLTLVMGKSHKISSHSKSPISLARLRTKFGERAFSHAGPATWNANHSATEPPTRCIGLSKQPAICRDVTRVQIASPVFHNQISTQMTTFCWIEFLLLKSNPTEAQIAEFKPH